MKLKFDPSLQYQQDAINAVVGVFDGQPFVQTGAMAFQALQIGGLFQTELGMGNRLNLPDEEILKNVHAIQQANDIEKVAALEGREFSVEMETGTGKTYIYLRSIFELNKTYGFKKFIIVVPSVAVREGVLKSIDVMKEHFQTLYDKAPFDHFVYDSKRLGKVRQFASSNQIQIMVINIQSFQKDVADKDLAEMTEEELKKLNVINRENDRMSGRRPIEFIQAAKHSGTPRFVVLDDVTSSFDAGHQYFLMELVRTASRFTRRESQGQSLRSFGSSRVMTCSSSPTSAKRTAMATSCRTSTALRVRSTSSSIRGASWSRGRKWVASPTTS